MAAAYMRFFTGNWKRKTSHLHPMVKGCYFELIVYAFDNGGIPDDDAALARIVGCKLSEWRKIRPQVEPFFIMPGWIQKTALEEREHAREKSKQATVGANARWREKIYEKIEENFAEKSSVLNPAVNGSSGETFEKTAEALCERIADALRTHTSSESESELERKNTSLNARERLDEIEGRLREAAGLQNSPSAGLFNLAPILGVIDGGCDFELDVLPTVRAKTHSRVHSWSFFVEAIWDARNQRLAAAEPRAATPAARSVQAPMPNGWRPSAEDVDYGKKLGFSQADLDWAAERLRQWATGKTATDWSATFRSNLATKAERDGKRLPGTSNPAADPKAAADEFYARMAERGQEKAG